jgi:hypothetical protein
MAPRKKQDSKASFPGNRRMEASSGNISFHFRGLYEYSGSSKTGKVSLNTRNDLLETALTPKNISLEST